MLLPVLKLSGCAVWWMPLGCQHPFFACRSLGGRRARSVAEGSLQQLEMAYNKLEDSEREKRAAGILKVKATNKLNLDYFFYFFLFSNCAYDSRGR